MEPNEMVQIEPIDIDATIASGDIVLETLDSIRVQTEDDLAAEEASIQGSDGEAEGSVTVH